VSRLAFALAVVALTAGARPSPHGRHPPPIRIVRAEIVSGTPQFAHAYAAPAEKKYYAEFPEALTVRWRGVPSRDGERVVRFTCVTECSFRATDQPDQGKHITRVTDVENAYDAKVVGGKAAVRVTVEGDTLGRYTVRAEPVARRGERPVAGSFVLTLR
jgi:hypothetical protein